MNTKLLIARLCEIQTRYEWSDREMGRQLRVNHTTWRSIRRGDRGAGVVFIDRALARFPELTTTLFLPVDVSVSHPIAALQSPAKVSA